MLLNRSPPFSCALGSLGKHRVRRVISLESTIAAGCCAGRHAEAAVLNNETERNRRMQEALLCVCRLLDLLD
jgi:hypothetical protein